MSPCPDCGAVGPEWRHDPTCPLHQQLERVTADDREWFAAQPHLSARTRRLDPAERALLQAAGYRDGGDWVTIRQLAPGVRVRDFHGWGSAA